jgi:hypothetical protein
MYTNQHRDVFTTFGFGFHVQRPTAVWPQTADQTLFTISGGRVIVTSFSGVFTVAASATANNLSVNSVPTVGTATVIASTLATASFEIGALLVVEGDGTALIGTSTGSGLAPALNALPFILPTGTITITCSANNTTGSIKWDLFYFPLDEGAAIVAA